MYIYNFLAGGLETGHLIKDDSYWVSLFKDRLEVLYTSEYSKKIQSSIFPQFSNKIVIINNIKFLIFLSYRLNAIYRCVTIPIPKKSKLLIQGFEEFSILFFIIIAKIRRNQIYLIPTNNICNYRINSKRWFLRGLIKIIYSLSDFVFYHNQSEKELIIKYHLGFNSNKFIFVKYHLLTSDPNSSNYRIDFRSRKIISFFGPEKVDKPIEPFLNLLKNDTSKKFRYKIYNASNQINDFIKKEYSDYYNLELISQFLSYEEYDIAVRESAFLFLSHNKSYEGKLSGNVCDCISKRKPFISNNISPVKEFMINYGKIGYVFDLENDQEWSSKFLNSIDEKEYNTILMNLENMQLDFTADKINQELNLVFSK